MESGMLFQTTDYLPFSWIDWPAARAENVFTPGYYDTDKRRFLIIMMGI